MSEKQCQSSSKKSRDEDKTNRKKTKRQNTKRQLARLRNWWDKKMNRRWIQDESTQPTYSDPTQHHLPPPTASQPLPQASCPNSKVCFELADDLLPAAKWIGFLPSITFFVPRLLLIHASWNSSNYFKRLMSTGRSWDEMHQAWFIIQRFKLLGLSSRLWNVGPFHFCPHAACRLSKWCCVQEPWSLLCTDYIHSSRPGWLKWSRFLNVSWYLCEGIYLTFCSTLSSPNRISVSRLLVLVQFLLSRAFNLKTTPNTHISRYEDL